MDHVYISLNLPVLANGERALVYAHYHRESGRAGRVHEATFFPFWVAARCVKGHGDTYLRPPLDALYWILDFIPVVAAKACGEMLRPSRRQDFICFSLICQCATINLTCFCS